MERIGYKVVLNFANLYGVEIEKREINGIMEDVMVIPLRLNGIYKSNKGLYIYGKALPSDVNPYNNSHYIVGTPTQALQKELKKLGYRPVINMGNMSVTFDTEGKSRPATKTNRIDDVLNQDF